MKVGLFLILHIIQCFRNLKLHYLKCTYYDTKQKTWREIFERISINGFRRSKGLEDILMRAKVASLEKTKG